MRLKIWMMETIGAEIITDVHSLSQFQEIRYDENTQQFIMNNFKLFCFLIGFSFSFIT